MMDRIMKTNDHGLQITPDQLAELGGGQVAYVKSVLSDDVRMMFPQVPLLPPGQKLFMLMAANGAPLMLSDSRDTALAEAHEHQLMTVSLH